MTRTNRKPRVQEPAVRKPERWLGQLVDPGSLMETDALRTHHSTGPGMDRHRVDGDGVIAGLARISGRNVAVYAQDPALMGGALGLVQAEKICRVLDLAEERRLPVVALVASGGARIQEGVDSLHGYGMIFRRTVALSGKVPQITVAMGTCAGGAVYQPSLTDVVIMIRDQSRMFITGPKIVESVTHEQVTPDELGGCDVHAAQSGLCSLVADSEDDAFQHVRRLLGYLDAGRRLPILVGEPELDDPASAIPGGGRATYDVRKVLAGVIDRNSFLELHKKFARNLVVGFARIEGTPVGIIANQPKALGGVLDCNASRKGARFLRLCNSFGLPVITFVDCPGYLPGAKAETDGITVHGAKLLHAYCEATVPRFTVVTRKSYGGAYIVLGSRSIGASQVFAWNGSEIGVMGARGAVDLLHRRDLAAADDIDGLRQQLEDDYTRTILHPDEAARRGVVDRVIEPRDTRAELARALSYANTEPAGLKAFPL